MVLMPRPSALLLAATLPLLVVACAEEETSPTEDVVTQPWSIQFAATTPEGPFSCDAALTPADGRVARQVTDLRLYVHDVVLLAQNGTEYPMALSDDAPNQNGGVALLDFEDGTGACANGTPLVATTVSGQVPVGDYSAVRFVVGVPFALNHQDPAQAAFPLTGTAMSWGWQGGYKFVRLEVASATDAEGGEIESTRLHLGSTGCNGTVGAISSCDRPNRPIVTLPGYTAQSQVLHLDVAVLVAALGEAPNTPMTAPGCMSGVDDPECVETFALLGLDVQTGLSTRSADLFYVE